MLAILKKSYFAAVEGAASVEAGATVSVETGATVSVEGATVSVEAGADVSVVEVFSSLPSQAANVAVITNTKKKAFSCFCLFLDFV